MFGLVAAETEAVVAGFLAALANGAPVGRCNWCDTRILAMARDIAARHRARARDEEAAQQLRAASVVLAAYRVLSGLMPPDELRDLLRDSWERSIRRARPSVDPLEELGGSRLRSVAAMIFCMIGLPGPYHWFVARFAPTRPSAAFEEIPWTELCAAESVPELTSIFPADGGPPGQVRV